MIVCNKKGPPCGGPKVMSHAQSQFATQTGMHGLRPIFKQKQTHRNVSIPVGYFYLNARLIANVTITPRRNRCRSELPAHQRP